jgi:hypothetical protein
MDNPARPRIINRRCEVLRVEDLTDADIAAISEMDSKYRCLDNELAPENSVTRISSTHVLRRPSD